MGLTSPTATATDAAGDGRLPSWLGEVLRLYPGYYLTRFRLPPPPPPLPPGATGALLLSGMFSHVQIYRRVLHRIRAEGVPASGIDFGSNMWGTIDDRVRRLAEAVASHAATGGRVVLVAHSMGSLVCARYLLDRPRGVVGLVSVCGVLGGIRPWTLLGWPIFGVVREMRRSTGTALSPELRELLRDPPVPVTHFQAAKDEFVRDLSPVADVQPLRTSVTHNGPVVEPGAIEAIAARVVEYCRGAPVTAGRVIVPA